MREKDLKLVVSDYLRYGKNQGKWWFERLNSGVAYVKRGDKYYAIQLCETGTADFMVLKQVRQFVRWIDARTYEKEVLVYCRVIFLELKGDKGKQRPEQKTFQGLVESKGAEYYIIRSIDELESILTIKGE